MENRVSPEEGGEAKLLLESTAPMAMMDSGPESRRCQASTGSYPACYRVKVQGPSSQIKIPSACSFGASSPQLLKSAKGPARLAAGAGGRTAAVRPRQQTPCCVAPPDGSGTTNNCPLAPDRLVDTSTGVSHSGSRGCPYSTEWVTGMWGHPLAIVF